MLCSLPFSWQMPSLTIAVGTLFILQAGRATKNHRKATSELLCPLRTARPEHGRLNMGSIESSWFIYGTPVHKCGAFKHLAFVLW